MSEVMNQEVEGSEPGPPDWQAGTIATHPMGSSLVEEGEPGPPNWQVGTIATHPMGSSLVEGGIKPEDREKHKKEQRLCNSLGSLLSGIGTGKVSVNTAPSNSNSKSDGDLAGPDLNVTYDGDQQKMASTIDSKGGSGSGQDYQSFGGSRPSGSGVKQLEVSSWDDLKYGRRQDDDDNNEIDGDWLAHETKKLDKLYGEGIVTVMFTEHNTIGYNCRLCFATMNAMKCLEMHCNGMKHLKKKGIYDKNKAAGELVLEPRKNAELPQNPEKGYNQSLSSRNSFARDKGHSYSRDERDPYARNYRDPYAREDRDPYARNDRDPYSRFDREPYSRFDRDPYAGDQYSRDSLERTDRRRSRSRSPTYSDRYRESDRLSDERSVGLNSTYGTMDSWNFRPDALPRMPSPPPARVSPPPKRPALELPPAKAAIGVGMGGGQAVDASLAGGPAAALLMKLSQCAIKNEKDAELASSIINLLLKSLKDYHQTLGEKSVADLMEQAEIKLGTAKAIRTIKKTTPSPQIDAVAIALETLRRANTEVPAFSSLI